MDPLITEALHEPCDRPAPDGDASVTHTHADDGRVCAWDSSADSWLTVRAVPKASAEEPVVLPEETPMVPYPPTPDQKEVGAYPKFGVVRYDGRDRPGGDREGAQQGYFVLDPIFDPAARPALAMYAMVVRQMGYTKFADDIDANLAILVGHVSDAVESEQPADARPLRAVATWTYQGKRADYQADGAPLPSVGTMAEIDQHNYDNEIVVFDDLLALASATPDVKILPHA